MTKDQREIQRKLRILRHAEEIGHVARTCRYFGIGRSSFYRWRQAYAERGEAGLINAPPIPKWHANRTPPEREDKVLYLRRKYHLGPMRIVWYLERYHDIKLSDATVLRILRHRSVKTLRRADLAKLTGCNLETIRYYENICVMPEPPRSSKNYRVYDDRHVARLRFIMRARELVSRCPLI
ncbi:MerR family transcriptional regulator [Roseovarius indicus]|uniref:Mercuric resistance operon regulatory protein n=1 Tax=Roseovarius indicus TaxID=540747 RepID=A0A5P3AJJ4_9RHOB|nr:Mercuric resistance operon regulatory protein [Roseovarius indicus]SFE88672.1 Homeodomain-like domain-containing protein [Roseovarius indicus]